MSFRVLISCPLILDTIDDYADQLAAHDIEYDVADVEQKLTEPELLEILEPYDGVLTGDDEFTRRVFESAPNLEVVSKWGIGIDAIDTDAAEEYDVSVYNTPGAFNDEVADVVIGYSIMLTRQLHHIDSEVREGHWACPRGVSLAGKTFGVVGVGNIGSAVVRRVDALGMDVLGTDVRPIRAELIEETGIERVDLPELLERAHVVSLNCALTDETRGLIGAEELTHLGADSYLINTARGELIDQEALVDALQRDEIAGAALDVFEVEPLPNESPLTELDTVVLGSHNAQNTREAVRRVNERAVGNLIDGLTND
jgi:D-3-phosphoglycerate dehydrogenase